MKSTETLKTLKKLKVDCLYTKDTHFNASQRIYNEAHKFKGALILGSIFAAVSAIMNVGLWDKIPNLPLCIPATVNFLGALGGFMIVYATTFTGYDDKIELSSKHKQAGNNINTLYKQVRNTEANYIDQQIDETELSKKLDEYTIQFSSCCSAAPVTTEKDFLKTKDNFEKGFSEYTKDELKI